MSPRPEELLGDVDEGFGKEERPSRTVPLPVDFEEKPGKSLGLMLILAVGLSGILPHRPDGLHVFKVSRDLPIEIQVGEDGLATPSHGLLGELEDHHLGQLLDLLIPHPHQIGGEKEVDRIPANGPGKIALQGCGKFDHVGQQHLRVLGRFGHGDGIGKAQPEPFDIFQGLP